MLVNIVVGHVLCSILSNLCYLHVFCVDMTNACTGDMVDLGVTESFQVKRQMLLSAAEAAEMILRVDDIVKAAPRYGMVCCGVVCGVV